MHSEVASSSEIRISHVEAERSVGQNSSVNVSPRAEYAKSPSGVIRVILIVAQLAGLISAACTLKKGFIFAEIYTPYRDAYIAIAVIGFVKSIVIYGLCLSNIWPEKKNQTINLSLFVNLNLNEYRFFGHNFLFFYEGRDF
jgi:hypothetical protein